MSAAQRMTPARVLQKPWFIVAAAMVCLAVAMGIGRFAFTPILPMMLHDGIIDLPSASWLASANYVGYLLGALLCAFQPRIWKMFPALPKLSYSSLVRFGLISTIVLTLSMSFKLPHLWPWLRFFAGISSALVFLFVSSWCMTRLAEQNLSRLSSAMFAGPGLGIMLSGIFATAMVQADWSSSSAWMLFGILALVLSAFVWKLLDGHDLRLAPLGESISASVSADSNIDAPGETPLLIAVYGLAGFGYIITATFLPVIARTALPGSPWLDLFWPIFGVGIILGALISTRVSIQRDLRYLLALCYLLQGVSVVATVIVPTLGGFATSSFLLGIPFTAITYFAMQEARRLRPSQVTATLSAMTAMYGIGQIVGPPLAAYLLVRAPSQSAGFQWSLAIASGSLFIGAMLFLLMTRWYPKVPQHRTT